MSAIHEFKCDKCGKRAKANYNGEHFLPPLNWYQQYDMNKAATLDLHLCDNCSPKFKYQRKEKRK